MALIVHTAQGRDRMRLQGIPAERLVLLPHGLLAPLPPAANGPMRGRLTLTLFGKIKPYKGADLLIEAFAGLPGELRDQARIRIVGKPYMDLGPLHRLVAEHDLAGQVSIEPRFVSDEEIGELFTAGVVAVFPYREIEASGVLPYALSHGRPVIASNLGSFAETLVEGVQGHLVPPGDVAALRTAIAHLLQDRAFAAACSASAWTTADQTPDWRTIGQQTADTYRAAGE
ncbi:glycosyltransferase [Roseomonas sp. BN140053]|uniref:glycosyltransferase n=1 Tax=Roseomonas sp. BN140053 TaxID=3391898 RepID=UPI0039E791CA